jgi:hypothetical protein
MLGNEQLNQNDMGTHSHLNVLNGLAHSQR